MAQSPGQGRSFRRVSLPMYNLPEMRADNSAFWGALRVELMRLGVEDVPDLVDFERRPVPPEIETDTFFTQVCGYPLRTVYRGQATMLAAPVYAVEHCTGPTHAGVFIVHRDSAYKRLDDLRGCRFAFNSRHSNSGMNLPRRSIADIAGGRAFFASIVETHSHPGNIERVARGEIDATCVDCVTYAFFRRHRPTIGEQTRALAATPPSPSIPFVTSIRAPDALKEQLRAALLRVAQAEEWSGVREGLLLRDIVPIRDEGAYAVLLAYEAEARELGYPELR
jgi:ABC-type phosphate/phosphonate transport system substrate-binding protein